MQKEQPTQKCIGMNTHSIFKDLGWSKEHGKRKNFPDIKKLLRNKNKAVMLSDLYI